jgi:hypothetical protein
MSARYVSYFNRFQKKQLLGFKFQSDTSKMNNCFVIKKKAQNFGMCKVFRVTLHIFS